MIKYILLDIAGTVLHKPTVIKNLYSTVTNEGISITYNEFESHHKLLSEMTVFPDKTSRAFYDHFNASLLSSLGIIPSKKILDLIFNNNTYVEWEPYDDVSYLKNLKQDLGVLSNFNKELPSLLDKKLDLNFKHIFVSETIGFSKPSREFFQIALQDINIPLKEILYIGDSFKLDYLPAVSLGINCLIIDRVNLYPKNNRHYTINSFSEIQGYI